MPQFTLLSPQNTSGVTLGSLADKDITVTGGSPEILITNVAVSGRELGPNGLFAALPGRHEHGAAHWQQARNAGGVAVLTDPAGLAFLPTDATPILVTADPRRVLGRIAARVYGTDQQHPTLFGVTGTNGKTSTVHLLDAILEQLGIPAGHSSTADRRTGPTTVASRLTSPEAPELHALLARMNEDGVQAAALEVSAQALSHHRVDGLVFDVAGFTNLTHDHQDEYSSMDVYFQAKRALFTPEHARRGVISLDSPAGHRMQKEARIPLTTITSLPGVGADWAVRVIQSTPTSTRFSLHGPDGFELVSTIPLVGRHMAADAGLAIVMLLEANIGRTQIASALSEGVQVLVPGRTDLLSGADGPLVYTDFSHTPDSIEKTLEALRSLTPGRLIVIIGADGEKDASKRQPMGRAAADGADVVIVTDHHQRFEDPALIREALLAGAHHGRTQQVIEVPAPGAAIRTAIRMATTGDTVLWVGPGQTDYRIVRGEDTPYSPRNDAREALTEAGWS